MKYIRRAVKYFLYVWVLLVVVLAILMATGMISSDINVIFKKGWTSVGWIAVMFAAVSALYPRFGYVRRSVAIPGTSEEIIPGIIEAMTFRGYSLEKRDKDVLTFRLDSVFGRLTRVWEDRITISPEFGGVNVEGVTKDVLRIVNSLDNKFRKDTPDIDTV
jgi:hypothetical protein